MGGSGATKATIKRGGAVRTIVRRAALVFALTTAATTVSAQKFVESPSTPANPTAPGTVDEAAPTGASTIVPVRLGNHTGFTRVIFDYCNS